MNTGPIEPSFDVFVDVIRSMLESPDTAQETSDIAILVLTIASVKRLLLNYIQVKSSQVVS